MKRISIIGLLIVGLIFQGCKNEKSDQEEIISEETENQMQEEVDTTAFSSDLEIEEDSSFVTEEPEPITKLESKPAETTKPAAKSTTTEKVVVKTTTETTKPAIKEEPVKKEVVVEEVVIKETEPKAEPIVEKPVVVADASNWVVPAKYKTMKNPTDAKDKENLSIGKSLYAKQCSSCHGSKGWGDGSKAPELKGDLGDFSTAATQNQTDGELFYKITEGRDDMPSFKKKIPLDEDRWLVVNYIRTLSK